MCAIPFFTVCALMLWHGGAVAPWRGDAVARVRGGAAAGGALWFTDLTLADETMLLPALAVGSTYALTQVRSRGGSGIVRAHAGS